MTETQSKGSGGPVPCLQAKGTGAAEQISKSEHMNVCPECGESFRFGSRDPCEGDYYWCSLCSAGPILFPLGEDPRRPVPSLIDADTVQAAMGIRGAAAAIQDTMFADVEPFDPVHAVRDLVGS